MAKNKKSNAGVVFLNPHTCGIYKNGQPRFKTDPVTGARTGEIDNELLDQVATFLAGGFPSGAASVPLSQVAQSRILVPTYWDQRYSEGIRNFLTAHEMKGISLGELEESRLLTVRGGHGSPGNDQRKGIVPYIKVSDIRALRINVNPTNLIPAVVAQKYWGNSHSGLQAWDLITPNRASSNIGEFAVLLPGEEQVVITKEVFILRLGANAEKIGLDPFYMLWALSLRCVRDQWRRIALMQTNREDCGDRYREVIIPSPPSLQRANQLSHSFRSYFTSIAEARDTFITSNATDGFNYVASVKLSLVSEESSEQEEDRD